MKIRITAGRVTVEAELFDTACAKAMAKILPIDASPNEWGDEFYFSVNVYVPLDEAATRSVKAGDIGYWPPGNAIAIFFGPTPLSSGADPVPASDVNLIGRIKGNPAALRKAKGASSIRIEAA
ncbi:MAG: putative cytosolic protein [Deltaproteobacteria bacterium]|nr:putative cytosolic protein [Deltaproteobacteria bacterium]